MTDVQSGMSFEEEPVMENSQHRFLLNEVDDERAVDFLNCRFDLMEIQSHKTVVEDVGIGEQDGQKDAGFAEQPVRAVALLRK